MPLLPDDPKKRQQVLILTGVLVLLGAYLYYQYYYTPMVESVDRLGLRLETLQAQNDRAKRIAQRFGTDLQDKVKLYERQLAALEDLIPKGQEVPELLNAIATQAQLSRVDLSRIRPASVDKGAYYTKYVYELAVIGEYHEVGRYLARIASLPRIIKPANLNVSRAPPQARKADSVAPVQATFLIETFVMGELAPLGTPAPAASSDD
jgi:type IV pilus assembly protein PilO